MFVQETDEHLEDGADSSSEEVFAIFDHSLYVQGAQGTNVQDLVRIVVDAIHMFMPSDEEMAHTAEVEVVFLWSRSSALTSSPTFQVQQMLDLSRGGNLDEDEDDSSFEEVLSIFVLCFSMNIALSRLGGS